MKRKLCRISAFAVLAMTAGACSGGDKASVSDTLPSIDTVKALDTVPAVDSVDSARTQAPPSAAEPAPRVTLPPPGGETYRRGSSTMSPREPAPPNDPPPNLIGETRREGSSTMSPTTRTRDSVTGPKMQIDREGKVSPIKR